MNILRGDILQYAEDGALDVIVHGCNCMCTMGAGLAKTIKSRYPEAYSADLRTKSGDKDKLGKYTSCVVNYGKGSFTIINGYTQYEWRGKGNKADYDAISTLFTSIKHDFSGKRIGYPKIGCGLAGGSWDIVSEIIKNALIGESHYLVEYVQ